MLVSDGAVIECEAEPFVNSSVYPCAVVVVVVVTQGVIYDVFAINLKHKILKVNKITFIIFKTAGVGTMDQLAGTLALKRHDHIFLLLSVSR